MPDEVDVNAGAARVDKILHPDGGNQMSLEQQEARAEMKEAGIPTRKTRSDAGKPRPPVGMVEIKLRVPIDHARRFAFLFAEVTDFTGYAQTVQDTIIEQLTEQIDRLRK
jgi:hypothetical protein